MIPFNKRSLILAPMAGITDSGFRKICRKYGADVTVSEMVSSKGIFYGDKKTNALLKYDEQECPIIIQIFGHDTECMKKAAEYVSSFYSPIAIDINMGCPAPKIFQNGDGCALMKNHRLAYDVIQSVKSNTDLPVSVKFRAGINENSICAVEFAKTCEQAKADFITVHGRTREQFYSGQSDKNIIRDVVNAVSIPVIANGDVFDKASADDILEYTGAHSAMIGRASLGLPTVFSKIKGIEITDSIFDIALEHLSLICLDKPEQVAVKEFRKHLIWYFKGIRNAAEYKRVASCVVTVSDCKKLLESVKKDNSGI